MIKCSICKRQTKENESTGRFNIIVYKNLSKKEEGTRILESKKVCMNCSGEAIK